MSEATNIAWTDSTAGSVPEPLSALQLRDFRGKMLAMNRKPWICEKCGQAFRGQDSHYVATTGSQTCDNPIFHRRRSFPSLIDWLDDMPAGIIDQDGNKLDPIAVLADFLDTLRLCNQMVHILCTKRPENFHPRMREVVTAQTTYSDLAVWIRGWTGISIPKNIILLTSVENQPMLDKRYKDSVAIPAACRGFSFEPLLSEIIVPDWTGISWAIISGESGPHARPCSVDWIRSLVEQGKAAGVPVFVKQGSGKRAGMQSDIPDDIWAVKEFPNRY
jgi:hypothetical protein